MSKKKRRKATVCFLIPCCGSVETEDSIEEFHSLDDTAVLRDREVVEKNDEANHQTHPLSHGQSSLESQGLSSDVITSSQDSDSCNTRLRVDSKKPKEPSENTVPDTSISRKSSNKKYHVQTSTESRSADTSNTGPAGQKCVLTKAPYNDEGKKDLPEEGVDGACLPELKPSDTATHRPSSFKRTLPTTSQVVNLNSGHVISYPAPPTSPRKMSNIRRASRPLLDKNSISSRANIDVESSANADHSFAPKTELKVEIPEKNDPLVRQPAPPSSPPKKASISRASRPRLPKEQLTHMDRKDSSQVQESDDIKPENTKGPTSTDLVTVFLSTSESPAHDSSSSTTSGLKLKKFKDLDIHSNSLEDLRTGATCCPNFSHGNEPYKEKFYPDPALVADISRIQKTERSVDFAKALATPDTNMPHPLGAASVVLGPIKTSKGTPEQTQRNSGFRSNMRDTSLARSSGLSVSRHLNFDQSVTLKNRCTDRCNDVASRRVPEPMVVSELEYSDSSSDEDLDHSGRPSRAATAGLPAPLPRSDLLAPSLFKRRAGQSLPPVVITTPASHLPLTSSIPGRQNRPFPNENRFNNRGRTKKF